MQQSTPYPIISVSLSSKSAIQAAKAIAIFVYETESPFSQGAATAALKSAQLTLTAALQAGGFIGKKDQSQMVSLPDGTVFFFIGLGKRPATLSLNIARVAAAKAVKLANAAGIKTLAISVVHTGLAQPPLITALSESAIMAGYAFDYNKTERTPWNLERVILADAPETKVGEQALLAGVVMGRANLACRDLVNTPARVATPGYMVKKAQEAARAYKLAITVLGKKELAIRKMDGILAVCDGSCHDPALVVLEYGKEYARKGKTYALVGKGVCFDAGGLDIKTAGGMETMKMDKAGAAAMLSAICAAAELKLQIHLYAIMPFVENLISATSYKPGDILTTAAGKTIEVLNTDAEGRIILADALHYATQLSPDAIIDAATLTGAVISALGNDVAGMMGNDARLMSALKDAGLSTFERVWELPMYDEYAELVAGDYADLKNVVSNAPGGPAGTIVGAKFLEPFVAKVPWVHLDIAGSAWSEKPSGYWSKGATGAGVRLLTRFLIDETTR